MNHDEQGNPTEFPPQVRIGVWDSAAMLAGNAARLVQTIVDKGTAGFRKCPQCDAKIAWDGDPQVAKYGLDLMRDLMKLFATERRGGGELAPGDLAKLATEMSDKDLESLLEVAVERQAARKAKPARSNGASTPAAPQ